MLDDILLLKVQDAISSFDNTNIASAFFSGSATLPFINSPHDFDLLVFVKKDSAVPPNFYVRPLRQALLSLDSRISLLPRWEDYFVDDRASLYFSREQFKRHIHCILPPAAYIHSFTKDVFGAPSSSVLPPGGLDVLTTHRDIYIRNLKEYYLSASFEDDVKRFKRVKSIYYGLCGVYFLMNNSYTLTDEQIRNVNIAHDRADGWEGLYSWLLSVLPTLS